MKHAGAELDALCKIMKALQTKGLENKEEIKFDIREEVRSDEPVVTKGKRRVAHKPNSKSKAGAVLTLAEQEGESGGGDGNKALSEEELWAKLEEMERREEWEERQKRERREECEERVRTPDKADTNGEDTPRRTFSSEKKEGPAALSSGRSQTHCRGSKTNDVQVSGQALPGKHKAEEDEEGGSSCLPTIYFSHTVEPKKVTTNAWNKTTPECGHQITSPADIGRLFVDVRNGEIRERNRGNSARSHAGDFEEQRMVGSSCSRDRAVDGPTAAALHRPSGLQPFSDTVVEKEPSAVPHLAIVPTAIPERRQAEVTPGAGPSEERMKQVSKFKAARLQRK